MLRRILIAVTFVAAFGAAGFTTPDIAEAWRGRRVVSRYYGRPARVYYRSPRVYYRAPYRAYYPGSYYYGPRRVRSYYYGYPGYYYGRPGGVSFSFGF